MIFSNRASKLYHESKIHSYKSISASYSFNSEKADKELNIARCLHIKGDSIYSRIWRLKIDN